MTRRLHYLDYRHEQMCLRKAVYPTEEAALGGGQPAYLCPYCGQWHRTSKLRPYS
jgi:hypothetical protein